jgi:hypothetical protein
LDDRVFGLTDRRLFRSRFAILIPFVVFVMIVRSSASSPSRLAFNATPLHESDDDLPC